MTVSWMAWTVILSYGWAIVVLFGDAGLPRMLGGLARMSGLPDSFCTWSLRNSPIAGPLGLGPPASFRLSSLNVQKEIPYAAPYLYTPGQSS